jgi:hypothetical protein
MEQPKCRRQLSSSPYWNTEETSKPTKEQEQEPAALGSGLMEQGRSFSAIWERLQQRDL